ncbi:uncharacterized protein LOC113515212 isoform X3 [Galleria mellonella]|uniref:Uncharacterized protein LOC113515212 isoform X3 n=1 Tax=Galleria mellonella TaxID=7137 RepID=A0ABM3MKA6_GALME|nr:uncharacterized protein LOC113515212 isoform X3 [Galleria mellonella]
MRQLKIHRDSVMTNGTMDKDKPVIRRPDVLKKFSTESLHIIERGLLGDLPEKLKPQQFIPRASAYLEPNENSNPKHSALQKYEKQSFFISCISQNKDSAIDTASADGDRLSPLKKTVSFREKLSRMNLFSKDKEKLKSKPTVETILEEDKVIQNPAQEVDMDRESKLRKRFWFFRNKDVAESKEKYQSSRPAYVRSKSFESIPRFPLEDYDKEPQQMLPRISHSFVYGSTDMLGKGSDVCFDDDDGVFLKSVKESSSLQSSYTNSSVSTETSGSSGLNFNILKTESVANVLKEFDRTVEMFSENYLSDSEPYTKWNKEWALQEKRKSLSHNEIPSPKIVQIRKVNDISEDFKKELMCRLNCRSDSGIACRAARRGSVTDWFVLEDKAGKAVIGSPSDRYRRAQKKPVNRVRRISSTKYWITPEECAVYSRDARPPLVIPRITQYRPPRRDHRPHGGHPYTEESLQDPVKSRQYDWSPSSERSRADIDRSFSKASSDSPPFGRINKRLGNSTETLLFHNNVRRPNQLHLPASSSGDSLDVEIREREPSHSRSRKSKSMMATKNRMRSPVPAPRLMLHQTPELPVVFEGPVKRTKFSENGKKSRKNWADCYVVLTHTGLVFYKDRKTYIAATTPPKPGTPPSPTAPRAELVLPLRHASVDYCMQMHTRRYTKSLLITVGRDQYLIQDESEANAATWLYHIKQIIYKMGPPAPDDFSLQIANKNSSTDLESLGRTPPPSRHNNRNKTKDEPVFGRKLEEVCPEKSPRVPNFVVTCIKEIESNEENMCTDGLYRASGNLSQVQKIRLEIDQNNISVIENNTDIHVLTGSLKLFFRELKEPLIPCSFFDRVLAACSIKPKEAKVKEFRDIVQALPQCNRDTLKFLLEHLLRVTQYSERNRMHTANLAIVFGPTLLWAPAEQAHNIAIDCIQQNNVVEFLLNELKDIFSEDTKGKKKV